MQQHQWSTLTRVIVVSTALVLLGLILYAIRPLVGPIVLSVLLAYVLLPAVRRLEQHTRLSHRGAVVTVYLLVLTALIAAATSLVPLVVRQAVTIPAYLTDVSKELETLMLSPVVILGRQIELGGIWSDLTEFQLFSPESLAAATENALLVLETTSLSFAWLLIILVTTFYLLLDWDRFWLWLINLAPATERTDFMRLLRQINDIWRNYIRGMVRLTLIMAGIFILILQLVGMPGAFSMGILTGILTALPEIGPVVGAIIAVLVALVRGSDFLPLTNFWFAILVGLIYLVIMQFYIIWLQPRVMGSYLRMNTGLVFVALVGAILVQGVLTAFLIVPLLATLGVIGRYVRCRLLNLDPWAEPETAVPPIAETPSSS